MGLAFYSPFYARENFIPLGKPGPTRTPFCKPLRRNGLPVWAKTKKRSCNRERYNLSPGW